MIQVSIQYLINKIDDLFQSVYGLTELIEIGSVSFPMFYEKGAYKKTFNPAKWFGTAYFRKNGNITFSDGTMPSYKANPTLIEMTIPLVFVATIKRDKLNCDSNYASDYLATYIVKLFTDINGLKSELKAERVEIRVSNYSTDAKEITESELKGAENVVKSEYAYLKLELNVVINTSKACMFDYCEGVIVDQVPNEVADQSGNNLIAL